MVVVGQLLAGRITPGADLQEVRILGEEAQAFADVRLGEMDRQTALLVGDDAHGTAQMIR
ncbi:MAG: hypothetical protein D6766_00325 [Verrucomicrobia bacterium]|nr:MAG: hypothetical protein D6766_00325 [Verrucomicrobiota bacterium]